MRQALRPAHQALHGMRGVDQRLVEEREEPALPGGDVSALVRSHTDTLPAWAVSKHASENGAYTLQALSLTCLWPLA